MTLADLINRAHDCGRLFSSWYIPLLKDGQPFEIDFEAEGSNDKGWHWQCSWLRLPPHLKRCRFRRDEWNLQGTVR